MSRETPSSDPYDALDECVKAYVSRQEYLWMPDQEKYRLTEALTTPDDTEDPAE